MNTIRHVVTPTLLVLALVLGGCAGGPTETSLGEKVDDSVVTAKVNAELVEDPITSAIGIQVETFRGTVQLSGFVDSQQAKERASQIAKDVEGVDKVINDLVVKTETQQ